MPPPHFQQACYCTGLAYDHFYPSCLSLRCFLSPHPITQEALVQFYFSLPGPPWTHIDSRKPPRLSNICLLPQPFHLNSLFRWETRLSSEIIREGAVALSSLLFPMSTWHRSGYMVGAHSMQMGCHLTQSNWSEKTSKIHSGRALEL